MHNETYLVNRTTGKSVKADIDPEMQFLGPDFRRYIMQQKDFAAEGHIIEFVELEKLDFNYFGVLYSSHRLNVILRWKISYFGIEKLE